jgi:hypothetical protein
MAFPSTATKAVADKVTAAWANDNVKSPIDRLASMPMVSLLQTTGVTGWTSATYTAVTFGTSSEEYDTYGMHDEVTNNSRVVIGLELGYYEVSGVVAFVGNTATTLVRAGIALNGSMVAGSIASMAPLSSSSALAVTTNRRIIRATSATDYVELMGWQTAASGSNGTLVSGGNFMSAFTVRQIAKP